MDLPIEVIEAVKPKPKARKPYVRKLTKRILHAINSGLRTSTSIANALGVEKAKIQSNMFHLKSRGLVYSKKQVGSLEHKYYLLSEKGFDAEKPEKKPRKPYAKRVAKVAKVATATPKPTTDDAQIRQLMAKLTNLEHTLIEKEKEVWTLECEVFDKKAIIKYLEEKLFQLGVRV
jgi:DNA-binding transcriptional MocR family regulator